MCARPRVVSSRPRGRRRRLAGLCGLLAFACGQREAGLPRSFELERISPKDGEVFLNHSLVFAFSEPVAPTSITSESLRIAHVEDGRPARGVFRVEGRQVHFLPAPVRSPDLLDGGFLPGARYEVSIAGFPLPDGVRTVGGLPLRCSYSWTFETAPLSDSPRDMFRDRTLGYSEPLRLVGGKLVGNELELEIGPDGPIAFECAEPLYPASIRHEDFWLERQERGGSQQVPFSLALVDNHDQGDPFPLGVARLELRPTRPLEDGTYRLFTSGMPALTDLGGNPVQRWPRPITVHVVSPVGEHVERFLDPAGRSSLPVPQADGTAWWGDTGVVTIRFPRAAGDGREGRVELEELEERSDVQATRIELAEDRTCELAAPGLVVLRAQGRLRISGRLVRRAGPGPPVSLVRGERLSTWLDRAREEDPPWTVLIAGGDLVIEGSVETDGPLVLVAGGWIRAPGEVRQQERQLWLLGEGGGMQLDPTRSSLELEIDPPLDNPLAADLRFAVLSVPVPAHGRVERWLSADAHGRSNGGHWRVLYVPFVEPGLELQPKEDPRAIVPAERVRLQIELLVEPPRPEEGPAPWSPPTVDEVHLHWEWDLSRGER